MEITIADKDDLDEMIDLLKLSLGESRIPKSKEYWQWKHEQNPFGSSKVLLAKENGMIAGLRAFMRWQWKNTEGVINTVRAVDTATHPQYQGKGIFSKLTMQAVKECTEEGTDFVFNTPNSKSMPGYLKMGWVKAGKLPLCIKPGVFFPAVYSQTNAEKLYDNFPVIDVPETSSKEWDSGLIKDKAGTTLNNKYISWRYQECPVARYGGIAEPGKFGFIFRVKKINRFIELRICDGWISSDLTAKKAAEKKMRSLIKIVKPIIITTAPVSVGGNDFFKNNKMGFWGPFSTGPVVTVRPLKMKELSGFSTFKKWTPSLGAMELF